MGGEIRDVDLVRDQFTLKVFGGRPVKILFDERTRIYRDGVAIALSDLRPEDNASVETALDGTDVFALRIHMLSGAPEGECQGQVTDYNSATGELTVRAVLSREPYVLKVSPKTSIERVGQNASASTQTSSTDLVKGSLVSVKFEAGSDARGIATDVSILATPGAAFAFGGNLSFLDLHAGRMVLLNAVDNTSYQISFDPAQFPQARDLHEGQNLNVTAIFDGSEYVANTMKIQSMVSSQAP